MVKGCKKSTPQNRKLAMKDKLRQKCAKVLGDKIVTLVMIVKNESKNIPRLIASMRPDDKSPFIIQRICIEDTGSTDDTVQVIKDLGKKYNIPTVVHFEPFRDFSYNRTHAVKMAQKLVPDSDYFLLSDADFVWEINVNGKFDSSLLFDHKYNIKQYNVNIDYMNSRMLNAKVDWKCWGLTHEFWDAEKEQSTYKGDIRVGTITSLVINDIEDGGCKGDKYERDIRLLKYGLEHPETPYLFQRYNFYLAQTLRDMGDHEESIRYYKERIKLEGWQEEIFYSVYQMGYNYERLGWIFKNLLVYKGKPSLNEDETKLRLRYDPKDSKASILLQKCREYFDLATSTYKEAHKIRKCRSESLYQCARLYRMLGRNELAYEVAVIGKKIKYPQNDSLFIERGCYDYQFDYELSICCFYIPGQKELGKACIKNILAKNTAPKDIIDKCECNARYYL